MNINHTQNHMTVTSSDAKRKIINQTVDNISHSYKYNVITLPYYRIHMKHDDKIII